MFVAVLLLRASYRTTKAWAMLQSLTTKIMVLAFSAKIYAKVTLDQVFLLPVTLQMVPVTEVVIVRFPEGALALNGPRYPMMAKGKSQATAKTKCQLLQFLPRPLEIQIRVVPMKGEACPRRRLCRIFNTLAPIIVTNKPEKVSFMPLMMNVRK
jgi:hypothetical protein